ncbi:hypothetical protein [Streptomyces atratus]
MWFAEPGTAPEADARAVAVADIALGNPRAAWVAEAPGLRWLQLASVGIDSCLGLDWPVPGRRSAVTNLGRVFADPVAESCLAGILALHRGIDELSGLRARGTRAKLYAFRGDAVHRCLATMPPTAPGRWSTD